MQGKINKNTASLRVDKSFPTEIFDTTAYGKDNTQPLRPDLVLRHRGPREHISIADLKLPSETSAGKTIALGAAHYQWIVDELITQGTWEREQVFLEILPITCTGMIPTSLIKTLESTGLNPNSAKRLCIKLHLRAARLQAEQIKSRWATDHPPK
jgi:hypothetical protein